MHVEQELKIAEEARISAEQDAAAQRYTANVPFFIAETSNAGISEELGIGSSIIY